MNERSAKVTNIPTLRIKPNPHNPRTLFDDEPMRFLEESIKKLGILVPLDVYPEKEDHDDPEKDTFVLLDGERRWRCAKKIGLSAVPSIVIATPSPETNILTMFHIHNLREGWQLMPTALKLQDLMEMLDTKNERELASLTRLSLSQVRRCKVLLTYSERIQQMMLAPPSERFKADFFIDLHRIRGPALEKKFPPWVRRGDEKCVDIMIEKYELGIIKAVTEFRKLVSMYRACDEKGLVPQFMKKLDEFLSNKKMGIDEIDIPGASFAVEAEEIGRSTRRLITQLDSIDLENVSSDEDLVKDLKRLHRLLGKKLEDALLMKPRDRDEI
jgi:ParB/RepB/Spo0J family partition protein